MSERAIPKSELPDAAQETFTTRIIPLDLLSQPDGEPNVFVISDTRLSDAEGERVVEIHEGIVAVNSLLLSSGWATTAQMRTYGALSSYSHFSRRIKDARRALTAVTGRDDAIEDTGSTQRRQYRIHPDIIFSDRRTSDVNSPNRLQGTIIGQLPPWENFLPGSLEFINPKARRTTFSSMVRQYINNPQVAPRVTALLKEAQSGEPQLLAENTLHGLFTDIDVGLAAYLQPELLPKDSTPIAEAIVAYHRVHATLVPFMHRLSRYFARTYPDFRSDLFQVASAESVRFLMEFDGGRLPELCEHFYPRAQVGARGAMLDFLGQVQRNQKALSYSQYELMRAVKTTEQDLRHGLEREPTTQEVADKLQNRVHADDIRRLRRASTADGYVLSVDVLLNEKLSANEAALDLQIGDWLFEEEVQRSFSRDSPLSDIEKIVLSLQFAVFSPHLRGATYRLRADSPDFTYPYTPEDFQRLLVRIAQSNDIRHKDVGGITGLTEGAISAILLRALRKTRVLYTDNSELRLALGYPNIHEDREED